MVVSREDKTRLIALFRSEFDLSLKTASELFLSSTFLFGRGDEVKQNLEKILSRSIDNFSEAQAQSTLNLMVEISTIEPTASEAKQELLERTEEVFQAYFRPKGKWQ